MTLSEHERRQLGASARQLLDRRSSLDRVRAVLETEDGFDVELWRQIVALGWTGIHVPDRFGGAAAAYAGLEVVLREMGRHLTPSPFLATAVLATEALLRAPNASLTEAMVPRLAAGEIVGTVALAGTDGSYEPAGQAVRWERMRTGGRSEGGAGKFRLTGQSGYVIDADVADVLIVAARSEDGEPLLTAVDARADGVAVTRIPMVDHTRRLFSLSLDSVVVPADRILAQPGEQTQALIDRVVSVGSIAVACDGVGVAERITELTGDYAKQRHQFGRPIGSFQAVKHRCADMAVAVEAGRASVRSAFEALDDPDADVDSLADVVSSFCGPAGSKVCGLAIRVHGGIGFTWEHDAHLFLKRAKLDEMLMGSPVWHRCRLSRRTVPAILAACGRSAPAGAS